MPWLITRWQWHSAFLGFEAGRWVGAAMVATGVWAYLAGLTAFGLRGCSPWPPAKQLVTDGIYAWTRNPMYFGAVVALAGQGLLLGSPVLILDALSWFVAFHVFVRWFDQGFLARTFGANYVTYYSATPRWTALSPSRQGHEPLKAASFRGSASEPGRTRVILATVWPGVLPFPV